MLWTNENPGSFSKSVTKFSSFRCKRSGVGDACGGWTVALPQLPLVVAVWNPSQNPFCEECAITFPLELFHNGTFITAVGENLRGG